MRLCIVLLLGFLYSCGESGDVLPIGMQCMFASGLEICSVQPMDPLEVDQVVQIIEEETAKTYPFVSDLRTRFAEHGVTVNIFDEDIVLHCHNINYDVFECKDVLGVAYNGKDIYIEYHECLEYTAFGHELLHAVEFIYFGNSQGDHDRAYMFNQRRADQGLSWNEVIEYRIDHRTFYETEGCKPYADK